jgi:hypothetical protein
MHGLIVPASVLLDVMDKSDSALLHLVDQLKLMENLESVHRFQLRFFPCWKRIHADIGIWKANRDGGFARNTAQSDQRGE